MYAFATSCLRLVPSITSNMYSRELSSAKLNVTANQRNARYEFSQEWNVTAIPRL